jgi:hypothetical protein
MDDNNGRFSSFSVLLLFRKMPKRLEPSGHFQQHAQMDSGTDHDSHLRNPPLVNIHGNVFVPFHVTKFCN